VFYVVNDRLKGFLPIGNFPGRYDLVNNPALAVVAGPQNGTAVMLRVAFAANMNPTVKFLYDLVEGYAARNNVPKKFFRCPIRYLNVRGFAFFVLAVVRSSNQPVKGFQA
jgi:hypothetical protein